MDNELSKFNASENAGISLFPARLKQAMELKGYSQGALAKAVGLTRQAIGLYISGQTYPDARRLFEIAKCLEVSTDWLLGITNARTSDAKAVLVAEICDKTGLSEESVNHLINLKNAQDSELIKLAVENLEEKESSKSSSLDKANTASEASHYMLQFWILDAIINAPSFLYKVSKGAHRLLFRENGNYFGNKDFIRFNLQQQFLEFIDSQRESVPNILAEVEIEADRLWSIVANEYDNKDKEKVETSENRKQMMDWSSDVFWHIINEKDLPEKDSEMLAVHKYLLIEMINEQLSPKASCALLEIEKERLIKLFDEKIKVDEHTSAIKNHKESLKDFKNSISDILNEKLDTVLHKKIIDENKGALIEVFEKHLITKGVKEAVDNYKKRLVKEASNKISSKIKKEAEDYSDMSQEELDSINLLL